MSTKIPPPLKPKPKVLPPIKAKKPDLASLKISEEQTVSALSTSSSDKLKKLEESKPELQDESDIVLSLRAGLRKTNRDWSTFEKKQSYEEDAEASESESVHPVGSSRKASEIPIIKPKPAAKFTSSKDDPVTPPKRSVQGVRLPGLAKEETEEKSPVSTPRVLTRQLSVQSSIASDDQEKSTGRFSETLRSMPPPPRHISLTSSKHNSQEDIKSSVTTDRPTPSLPSRSRTASVVSLSKYSDSEDQSDSARSRAASFTSSMKKMMPSRSSTSLLLEESTKAVKKLIPSKASASSLFDEAMKYRRSSGSNTSVPTTPSRPRASSSLTTPQISGSEDESDHTDEEEAEEVKPRLPARRQIANDGGTAPAATHVGDVSEGENESEDEDRPPLPTRPGLPERPSSTPSTKKAPPPVVSKKSKPKLVTDEKSIHVNAPQLEDASPPPRKPEPPKPRLLQSKAILTSMPAAESTSPSLSAPVAAQSQPPPPPKPRSRGAAAPPPPTPRSTSQVSQARDWKPVEPNLDLSTGWFASDDFDSHLPKDLQGLPYATSYGYNSKENFRVIVFRFLDLSTFKLKLEWSKTGSPVNSVTHETKHIPPPMATKQQLLQGSQRFGDHVASWCEDHISKKVGDGECWTLAHDALEKGCGKHSFVSSGLQHGALIKTYTGTEKKGEKPIVKNEPATDILKRGDVLQFKDCCFRFPHKAIFYGSPDHTAIILEVEEGEDGFDQLTVAHQNVNGSKVVVKEKLELSKLLEGELKVFRPVAADWIEELTPMW
ncbi:hypothetical protein CANARDRAFT_74713 [[Candida] arabinofermentans NRRL YB-2248]|uniref:BBC1/AIM3 cysteine proteinase-fold domain-containing protein n=1 Tax=[Candida] arabinofermentans NRRL YB-2248 TaxID=983967 RepID=A0A1E4SW33_9ASCO|nr:hypothetical protein CANARDRAFT_74713 [[Candida] arabinofermentans NRRL YB-2248]